MKEYLATAEDARRNAEVDQFVTKAQFSLKPILEPFHIKTMAFTSNIDGQHIMLIPHLQCPKHWHTLGSVRCSEHEYCAKTEVCSACVEEAKT